jgi:preprotein translocase subunit SecD
MIRRLACALAALVVFVSVSVSGGPAAARTARSALEVRAVLAPLPPASATSSTVAPADRVDAAVEVATCDTAAVQALAVVPTTTSGTAKPKECVVYPDRQGGTDASRYYLGPATVTTAAVRKARAEPVSGQGWTVRLELTKSGSRAWDDLSRQQFHGQVAFVVDGQVVAAPTIQPSNATFESFDGVAVISGAFGKKGAAAIARLANGR